MLSLSEARNSLELNAFEIKTSFILVPNVNAFIGLPRRH